MALDAQEIFGFSESLLKSRYDDPVATPDFHMELWDLCCLSDKHVAIAAPRGHAKSTAVTHAYALANVLFREAEYVMIVSDTEEQAKLFLEDIKLELIENEKLMQIFGVKRLLKDTDTDIICLMDDGHRFRIIAKGSMQKIRGRKWRNRRPDLIIGDDLENDEIVMNEDRRAKFRRWMNKALIPTLSKKGRIRIVGTILHLDSFLERCMPPIDDEKHTKWSEDGLKSWSTAPRRVWKAIRYRGHPDIDDYSALLWPQQWPEERYREEYDRYVEDGEPEGYAQEYLNWPVDETHAFFPRGDFLPWEHETETFDPLYPGEYLEYYIGGDLAISEKEGRAYTVFVVVGMNRQNLLVVVEVVRFRGDSLYICDELFRLQEKYNPELVFLEEENIARSIGPFLYEAMIDRGTFIPIEPMPTAGDKPKRAQSIRARHRAGGIRYNTKGPWFPEFQMELVTFPRSKYMDQVDAFAHIGMGLTSVTPVASAKEIAQWEYDDEFAEDMEEGKSYITGY